MKRNCSILLALLLTVVLAVPVLAAPAGVPHVVDAARVLEDHDYQALERHAKNLSEKYQFDFVIVTVDTIGPAEPQAYADDYFDYNDYGYGPDHDGVLLLVVMDSHAWHISTLGSGVPAFTAYGREQMMDEVIPDMTDGDFAGAFKTFLGESEYLLKQAREGHPVDEGTHRGFPWVSLLVCGGLGFGLAFIPMSVLKKQVRNVAAQPDALGYADALDLSENRDRFLYSSVSRRPRPKDTGSSGSGGSSTHTSSSGRTHGGSGGSF